MKKIVVVSLCGISMGIIVVNVLQILIKQNLSTEFLGQLSIGFLILAIAIGSLE